jgi:hypothetical protein
MKLVVFLIGVLFVPILAEPLSRQGAPKSAADKTAVKWTKSVVPAADGRTQDKYETQVSDTKSSQNIVCRVRIVNGTNRVWLDVLPAGHTELGSASSPDPIFLRETARHQVLIESGQAISRGPIAPVSARFAEVCGAATRSLPADVQKHLDRYLAIGLRAA